MSPLLPGQVAQPTLQLCLVGEPDLFLPTNYVFSPDDSFVLET